MDKLVEGQLVEVTIDKAWYFGVVTEIFDDMYYIITENNHRVMKHNKEKMDQKEIEDTLIENSYVRPLLKDGKPVMAKKKLFGGYKFEAKD